MKQRIFSMYFILFLFLGMAFAYATPCRFDGFVKWNSETASPSMITVYNSSDMVEITHKEQFENETTGFYVIDINAANELVKFKIGIGWANNETEYLCDPGSPASLNLSSDYASLCGNGTCDYEIGENCTTCPADCGLCNETTSSTTSTSTTVSTTTINSGSGGGSGGSSGGGSSGSGQHISTVNTTTTSTETSGAGSSETTSSISTIVETTETSSGLLTGAFLGLTDEQALAGFGALLLLLLLILAYLIFFRKKKNNAYKMPVRKQAYSYSGAKSYTSAKTRNIRSSAKSVKKPVKRIRNTKTKSMKKTNARKTRAVRKVSQKRVKKIVGRK